MTLAFSDCLIGVPELLLGVAFESREGVCIVAPLVSCGAAAEMQQQSVRVLPARGDEVAARPCNTRIF